MSTGTAPPTAPPAAGRRQTNDRNHQNNRPSSQFVPKIPGIEILGTSTKQRGHDLAKFLKSIHHHALTTFRHSKDISSTILEFKDPLAVLRLNTLSLSQIRTQNNLNPSLQWQTKATLKCTSQERFIPKSNYLMGHHHGTMYRYTCSTRRSTR